MSKTILLIEAVADAYQYKEIAGHTLTVGELQDLLADQPRNAEVALRFEGAYGRLEYTRMDDGVLNDNDEFVSYLDI